MRDEYNQETENRELPPLPEPPDMPPPPEADPPTPPSTDPTVATEKPTVKKTSKPRAPKKEKADGDTVHATTAAPPPTAEKKPKTSTNASKERNTPPKKQSDGKSNPPPSGNKSPKGRAEPVNLDAPRSSRPAHRVLPYIFLAFAVFLTVCLLLNLLCNPNNRCESDPSAHWMGSVGYGICYGLFGLFGPAVFLLPLLLLNMARNWRIYIDKHLVLEKTLVSLLLLFSLSATVHAFNLSILSVAEREMTAGQLLQFGAQMRGGGLIGGGIGCFLAKYLNVLGSILVSLLGLSLSTFFFLGITPRHLLERIRTKKVLKHSATTPLGVDDEEAIRAEVQSKHKRAANRGVVISDTEQAPPEGAVQVVKTVAHKPREKQLADIPMPRLDATADETDSLALFVPAEVRGGEKSTEAAVNAEAAPTADAKKFDAPAVAPSAPVEGTSPTTPATEEPKPVALPAPKSEKAPTVSGDAAMEKVFPRSPTELKNVRRVQKSDKNFELGSIFVELEDHEPEVRRHVPLPPEVPMPNANPMRRTVEDPEQPTVRLTAPPKPPVRRPPASPVRSAPSQKPVLRQAQKEDRTDFGLTNEEFEKDEAAKGINVLPPKVESGTVTKTTKNKPIRTEEKKEEPPKPYVFPPISYLAPPVALSEENRQEITENTEILTSTLHNFGVNVKEITYSHGPTVTRYEIFPDAGVRVRTIMNLADDIALAFAAGKVRMEAIAGKSAIGVEVPNRTRQTVFLRELIESKGFRESESRLLSGLGSDVTGAPLLFDIVKMPHLLIAGATGMGKSVCINCIITSILYRARPDEVKLILIDPKQVEFTPYKGIPHLLAPIVSTPKDAAGALQAAVNEMEERYLRIGEVGVRNIDGYNKLAAKDPDLPYMPHIVIIIDELADLMMSAKDEVETSICRLAQKARAAGMHVIVGTQRPSVDVVTGLIKANIPSRIACTVASYNDSRTILDNAGAEVLLGKGDMLFSPVGSRRPTRVQGAFVGDEEVEHICEFLRTTNGTAVYSEAFTSKMKEYAAMCGSKKNKGMEEAVSLPGSDGDNKYVEAIRICLEEKRVSTSLLQRKLSIGYSRAAKLIDRMEEEGLVGKADGAKARPILITAEQFIERYVEGDAGREEDDETE